jgi:RHS repeat-associated protein
MMPASKHGDPQLGIDIHMCAVPPSPSGVPLPVPHMSVVFDPFDYIPIIGATVTVCGMKRATAGTNGMVIHIPPGFPILPIPKPPEKDDELFMGSATVIADGDPMSHIAHPVLACQIAGMPSIPRLRKKGPKKMMLLPLTFNLAIPTNVFIGGPPTISLMGLAMKGAFSALGKFAKSGLFKRMRQKLFGNLKPGFLKCAILRAEPVNILSGDVSVEQRDFALPGRIPIEWLRTYSSGETRVGLCGRGWLTPADAHLSVRADEVVMQFPGVGPLSFDRLPQGEGAAYAELELIDGATLTNHGDEYRVRTKDDRVYHFPKILSTATHTDEQKSAEEISLHAISDPFGNHLVFERTSGKLTGITESAGRRIEIAVRDGRLHAVGMRIGGQDRPHIYSTYEYDSEGDLTAVRDALESSYTFAYESTQGARRMVRHTDRNNLSFQYKYDDSARVVRAWGDHGLYSYKFEYLDAVNERRITDSLGNVSLVKLDERGLPLSEIDALGGMTLYEYDDAGRTIGVTNPDGHRAGFTYDERGNLLATARADGTSVATRFDALDKPIAITDPNGNVWLQEWDARGQLVRQTTPLGHHTRYTYDEHGQLTQVTDPRDGHTQLGYDAYGNLTRLTDAVGNRTRLGYDVFGNITGRLDALERTTHYAYDAKGRLTETHAPSGATIRVGYDGEDNLTRYVDANGAQTRFEYFGQGQVAKRIDADGTEVEYLYDTEERLIGVRNQRGERCILKRDALGRVVEEVDYWGQASRYEYTLAGRIQRTTDPLGRSVAITTDPLGRILAKLSPDPAGGAAPFEEKFACDANGNLLTATNPHVPVARKYDAENRLLEEKQGEFSSIANRYDESGNRIERSTTLNAGGNSLAHRVEYTYDAANRLASIAIDGATPVSIERDVLGRVLVEQLSPDLRREIEYSTDGGITRQRVRTKRDSIVDVAYSYDVIGNLIGRSDAAFGAEKYVYDPLERIVEHVDPHGVVARHVHDAAGAWLETRIFADETTPGGSAREWSREGQLGDALFRFDRAGRLTHRRDDRGDVALSWDANDRLIESRTQDIATQYRYDALGRRVAKRTGTSTTLFAWDRDALAAEATLTDERLSDAREFVYRAGDEEFEPFALITTESVLFYQNEPNGAPTRLIDARGAIAWAASFSPWQEKARVGAAKVDNPLRLQGQYFDTETGLHYNRHRYFDPRIAQFVSRDPIGLAGGDNPEAFAPNPLHWVDPLGLKCKTIILGENMGRIKAAAKHYDAWWYQAWGKNFKPGAFDLDKSLARNERWLRDKIKKGYTIIDIGIDPTRASRSDFYALEQRIIRDTGYPTTKVPWP